MVLYRRVGMQRWINPAAIIVLCGFGLSGFTLAQDSTTVESKFLTIGDITKIDMKEKSITIDNATSYNIAQLRNGGTTGAPVDRGGRGGGGAAVRSGRGGRRGSGGAVPTAGRGPSAPIPMEYKVSLSPKTIFKEGDHDLKIEDLKVGD